MKKRILSMLLLGAMLTSLAACGGDSEDSGDKGSSGDKSETAPAGIEATNYNLPFRIYAPADDTMYSRYYFTDDAGTDVMSKAIYEREILVEEHLGVDIDYTLTGDLRDVKTTMQNMVMTGEDTYQLVLTHCISGLSAMIVEDLLYDFNDFEYVDMTNEWWNQQAREALSVNGYTFYTVSDYMLPDVNCVLVNKSLLEEFSLENPYDLVRDGTWTIDKMMEMMSAVTTDNGDGRWNVEDQYGLGCPDDFFLNAFIYAFDVSLIEKDNEGNLEFAFDNERAFTMVEKIDQLLMNGDAWVYKYTLQPTDEESLAVSKGRTLFNIESMGELYKYRDTEVDYGILPYPKLEAAQEAYQTNAWSGMMSVPKTVKNSEMVGKVIELLSYYSQTTTVPAYFDLVLGEKLARDTDSKEMLGIIFDGVVYDAGASYFGFDSNMNQLFYTPHALIINGVGATGFSSHLAQYQPAAEATIEEFNETVNSIVRE
ncbi:MAG: carbohydrate ABC transporter substrate-binding protein [Clostridia bacterium]|nr:carbohydrate ABC transporter substrate-binding protein [Clostridia bacterium]